MGDNMGRRKIGQITKVRLLLSGKRSGFTLLEAVVGIALVAIAILGLAQMFTLSVMNNMRSDRITNATFLAQQQIDIIRNLTVDELTLLASSPEIVLNEDGTKLIKDQLIDLNSDTKSDYRRITEVQPSGTVWKVDVLIFTQEQFSTDRTQLLANPQQNRVKAKVSTIISR